MQPWRRFVRTHLHDYNRQARNYWLALQAVGVCALAWSLAGLATLGADDLWQAAGWTAIVLLAAAFPIQIPRSKHSIATGDIVVFLLLALHGAAAATVAAALEAFVASRRTSARLSSHLASTAAGATAMALGGALFELSQNWLAAHGLPPAAAHMAALGAAALVHFGLSTMALMQVVCLKRGQFLNLRDWLGAASWVGTLYLVSSVLAGVLSLNAQHFGRSAAAVGVLVIGLSLALLRAHFRQQIAEHDAQEARVAAAELEARQNQKRFHAAFTHASIGMAIVSLDGKVLQVNQALCMLVGLNEPELLGSAFRGLLHPADAPLLQHQLDAVVARQDEAFSIELRCRSGMHGETWVSLHCSPYDDQGAAAAGLIYQLHDIGSRHRAGGARRHVAYHDSLTDLANRDCFHERLRAAVERCRNERRFRLAVMVLDLDRFKMVNDSLGHPAGDALLREVARRLAACLRPRDLVARLGSDEFAILLEQPGADADVLAFGDHLLKTLEQPLTINGTELRPMASIGLTFSDHGDREPDEMLQDADLAMCKAKADGKGRVALFDTSLHEQLGDKLQLEADLRRAIGDGQLSLAYQPLFDLTPQQRLSGFEALMRWTHPTRGVISPGVFIALAEETGCIEALTQWALDQAIRQQARWTRDTPDAAELVMHVNVSGKDLSRPQLVPHIRQALQRHGLVPRQLVLEVTESTLMEHREAALRALAELTALGVGIGIDDFGTGYSSLAYLSTLPFDCLKIDRSFVIGMDKSPKNLEIVRTVISLGRTLNKQVVAEGIETRQQLRRLRQLGATTGQGYLLSRPLDAAAASELLREQAAVAA